MDRTLADYHAKYSDESSSQRPHTASTAAAPSRTEHLWTTCPATAIASPTAAYATTVYPSNSLRSATIPARPLKRSASSAGLLPGIRCDPPLAPRQDCDTNPATSPTSASAAAVSSTQLVSSKPAILNLPYAQGLLGEHSPGDIYIVSRQQDMLYKICQRQLYALSSLFVESLRPFPPRGQTLPAHVILPAFLLRLPDPTVRTILLMCRKAIPPAFEDMQDLFGFIRMCDDHYLKQWLWLFVNPGFCTFATSDPVACLAIALEVNWGVGITIATHALHLKPRHVLLPQLESLNLTQDYRDYMARCVAAAHSTIHEKRGVWMLPYFSGLDDIAEWEFKHCPHAPDTAWKTIRIGRRNQYIRVPEYLVRVCSRIREQLAVHPITDAHFARALFATFIPEIVAFCGNTECAVAGITVYLRFKDAVLRDAEAPAEKVLFLPYRSGAGYDM
ncbi:hypothetical protein PsYK624_150170 [Phanerochaete sordida]|uniref:Uncharacterized protein n=1 Tax=Phanerochaete sordida TaxID=48140 RepID=A0A9P3GPH9_9APHY|nr:hypothetical protein PsYK624_150170 [Phanerochaete sordida]